MALSIVFSINVRILHIAIYVITTLHVFFSGNIAFATDDLREHLNVSILVLIVNATQGAQVMLNRLVGDEFSQQRIISIPSITKLNQLELLKIGQALCGTVDIAASTRPAQVTPHRTTKREVNYAETKRK